MDAEHARPALEGQHVGGDSRGQPVIDGAAGDPAQERLAARADDHRAAERHQLVQARQELEVVLGRLAEADPGVEQDALLGTPQATAKAIRSSRKALTSETTSS